MNNYQCDIWGGYRGKWGSVLAQTKIVLPFMPYDGLHLVVDDLRVAIDDNEICYCTDTNRFKMLISDVRDIDFFNSGGKIKLNSLNDAVTLFSKRGWEILEVFND